MKTLLMALIIVMTAIVGSNAQGYRRAGTNTQTKAMYKDELKLKMKLSERQATNIDALQQDYMLKMRAVKIATTYTTAERKEKLDALITERNEKLKTLLTKKQIAKLDEIYSQPNDKQYPPGETTIRKTDD